MVDDHWFQILDQWRWGYLKARDNEYAQRHENPIINGKKKRIHILMHQVVAGYKNPDHIDGNGLNNQEANLRPATNSQNQMNQRLQKSSKSGFKGVSWYGATRKWQVQIKKDGKHYFLGRFSTPEEAARAYDAKARELFGEFARLNFPD
jgi:hypothetical protein